MRYTAPLEASINSPGYTAPIELSRAMSAANNPNITAALNYITPSSLNSSTSQRADSVLQNIGGELSGLTKSSSGVSGLIDPEMAQQMQSNPTSMIQNYLTTTMGIPPALLQKMIMGEGAIPDIQEQQHSPSYLSEIGNFLKSGGAGIGHAMLSGRMPQPMMTSLATNYQNPNAGINANILPYNKLNVPHNEINKIAYKTGEYAPLAAGILTAGRVGLAGLHGIEAGSALGENEDNEISLPSFSSQNKIIHPKAVQNSAKRIISDGQNLIQGYKKGYNVLNSLGSKNLLDPSEATIGKSFGGIFNPKDAADYLEKMKNQSGANSDILDEARNLSKPDYTRAVESKIDPNILQNFKENFGSNKLLMNKYNDFSRDPTAEKAGDLMPALSNARTGESYDSLKDNLLGNMRDELRDKIISPGINRIASPEQADKYSLADINYREYMQKYGNNGEAYKLTQGRIHPNDLDLNRYYNMLKNLRENNSFSRNSIQENEYNNMQKLRNKDLGTSIGKHLGIRARKMLSKGFLP